MTPSSKAPSLRFLVAALLVPGIFLVSRPGAAGGAATSLAGRAAAAIPNLAGKALTVTGPVDPSRLGQTLMHEHIFIDFKKPSSAVPTAGGAGVEQFGPQPPGWNLLNDYEESLSEVMAFKKAGGHTIVDVTNIGLSRNPAELRRISQASGLLVVMGAGWYQKGLHAEDMTARTLDELTEVVVRDVTVGAQGTTIRSGIIGEVGVQGKPLTDNELKSVRASARAARITGAPMTIHSFGTPDEMQRVLDIVAAEGVDLSRVVMSHTGGRDMEYMKQLFARGVYVEYDFVGQAPGQGPFGGSPERDAQLVQRIAAVISAGFVKQLMVSHDICIRAQLKKNGGGGYAYVSNTVIPGLKRQGVSDADIRTFMVDNPRRVLTFVAPQPVVAPTAAAVR